MSADVACAPAPAPARPEPPEPRAEAWRRAAREWVYADSTSRGPARAVLLVLGDHLGPSGDAVIGYGALADGAGISVSTAQAAVARLCAAGELVCVESGGRGSGGRGHANRYRLPAVPIPSAPGLFTGGALHNPPPAGSFAPSADFPNQPGHDRFSDPNMAPGDNLGTENLPPAGTPGVWVVRDKGSPSEPSRATTTATLPNPREAELINRLVAACSPSPKFSEVALRATARKVVPGILEHLDWRVVDEIIGYMGQLKKRPDGPVYAYQLVNRWRHERGWTWVPELRLDGRTAPTAPAPAPGTPTAAAAS